MNKYYLAHNQDGEGTLIPFTDEGKQVILDRLNKKGIVSKFIYLTEVNLDKSKAPKVGEFVLNDRLPHSNQLLTEDSPLRFKMVKAFEPNIDLSNVFYYMKGLTDGNKARYTHEGKPTLKMVTVYEWLNTIK